MKPTQPIVIDETGGEASSPASPPDEAKHGLVINSAVAKRLEAAEKSTDLEQARKTHNRRMSKKLRNALKLIVEGERSIAAAAEKAGMTDSGLRLALDKPHVLGELKAMAMRKMQVAGAQAVSRLAHLSAEARSEYVQLQASQDLANRAGLKEDPGGQGEAQLVININLG